MSGHQTRKSARIDLGLALLSIRAIPGVPLTQEDIAAGCGCTRQAIENIERKAMQKLRNKLIFQDPQLWHDLRMALTQDRSQGKRKITSGLGERAA